MDLLKFLTTCWTLVLTGALATLATSPARADLPSVGDLESLWTAVAGRGATNLAFSIHGVVHAVDPQFGNVVIEDETATLLLEIPAIPTGLRPGMTVELTSRNCRVVRGAHALRLGTAPLLDFDGLHGAIAQQVTVTLAAGPQPFRLEWFNGAGPSELKLEVEGENLPRMKIPDAWFKQPAGAGLEYRRFSGARWYQLPDFSELQPAESGIVPGLDPEILRGKDSSAAVYLGTVDLPRAGDYSFYLSSDDGSRVFLGDPGVTCSVVPGPPPDALLAGKDNPWGTTEGTVTFAGRRDGNLELELAGTVASTPVTILNPAGADPRDFLGKTVTVTGLKSASGVVALDRGAIDFFPPSGHPPGVLTTAAEIHQLRPEEADTHLSVRLRGVVTMVSPQSIVLQDSSGGVYIHYVSTDAAIVPRASEVWEATGITAEGDFSPVVQESRLVFQQAAELPRGVKPTREQFADGSLDAEQVEIEGIVRSSTAEQLELLTQEGPVFVIEALFYPLPTRDLSEAEHAALPGSVVKLRGVYTATWEQSTRRVTASRLRLGNAILSVTSPAPNDPFATELIKASDLLLFNSETRALQRVKVTGTVLLRKQTELFVHDGTSGFRVFTRETSNLARGDRMEAVGFPRLEGNTPTLVEAQVRKIGIGALPLPQPVAPSGDPSANPKLDSTLVTVHGNVLSDTRMESDRTLELEDGPVTFLAHIPAEGNASASYRKGSQLAVTGVYVKITPGHGKISAAPFEIEAGDPADIRILHNGPWWTPRHTFLLIFTLCLLLLLTLGIATYLQRTVVRRTNEIAVHIRERAAIEKQSVLDQERSRVAQDLHDELGAGLTEAGILASLAGNPSIPAAGRDDYLKQLGGVCRHLVTDLDEIVWAVNPAYHAVSDLASYFSLFAQQLLHLADIRCRLHIPASIPAHRLESQVRHGIFLAFKESLNNVVKHSGATVVHLTVEIRDRVLFIDVADDGRGFDVSVSDPAGRGLSGMRTRIEQLGGTFHLQSSLAAGTEINFNLPLENP